MQASSQLKDDGLLVLTGAQAALQPTPTMIGYGMAKVCSVLYHLFLSCAMLLYSCLLIRRR
jgi:hypothetical protein